MRRVIKCKGILFLLIFGFAFSLAESMKVEAATLVTEEFVSDYLEATPYIGMWYVPIPGGQCYYATETEADAAQKAYLESDEHKEEVAKREAEYVLNDAWRQGNTSTAKLLSNLSPLSISISYLNPNLYTRPYEEYCDSRATYELENCIVFSIIINSNLKFIDSISYVNIPTIYYNDDNGTFDLEMVQEYEPILKLGTYNTYNEAAIQGALYALPLWSKNEIVTRAILYDLQTCGYDTTELVTNKIQ